MKMSAKWMVGLMAAFAMVACSAQNDCKFNVKEYAEGKTERLDEVVELTDAQEKEVYALYVEQGKQIKKAIKQMNKEGFDHKRPEGPKKGECPKGKPECDKAAACDKCDKANCDKPACDKAKGECPKGKTECKGECDKANCKKAECQKGACDKANCDKKAECAKCDKAKGECKKANCDKAECKGECPKGHKHHVEKPAHPRHPRHMVNPAERKAFFEKLSAILTPEQQQILKDKMMERRERRGVPKQAPQCCPSQSAHK